MVREEQQQQQQQPPIMRDFLGLGKLVTDNDQGQEEGSHGEPTFRTIQGLHTMDFTGAKHPVCKVGLHNFVLRKASGERYLEGSAESYGLANARQSHGSMPGTNTSVGGPPTRVLASGAYAQPNGTQLTIFYGGLVNVYNNIPVDKAQEIMHLAAMGNPWPSIVQTPPSLGMSHALAQGFGQPAGVTENLVINARMSPIHFAADQASQNGPSANNQFECETPTSASSPQHVVPRALPLARKASLARFLERRKERMQMMSPYFKKQLIPGQVPSADPMLGSFQGPTLSKLYEEYFRRPLTMVYGRQEPITSHANDVSSRGIPAEER